MNSRQPQGSNAYTELDITISTSLENIVLMDTQIKTTMLGSHRSGMVARGSACIPEVRGTCGNMFSKLDLAKL